MARNPFHTDLDDHLRGERVRVVSGDGRVYVGWLQRTNYQDDGVLLLDASRVYDGGSSKDLGPVVIESASTIECLDPGPEITRVPLDAVQPSPYHVAEFSLDENRDYVGDVQEDGWVGSFPVVRQVGVDEDLAHADYQRFEVVEGHKRVWAARQAGLRKHQVKVVDVGDWVAARSFVHDHVPGPHHLEDGARDDGWYSDDDIELAIEGLLDEWGQRAIELDRVDFNAKRLGMDVVPGLDLCEEEPEEDTESAVSPKSDGGSADEQIVYVSSGHKNTYHEDPDCHNLDLAKNAFDRQLSDVEADLDPCGRCTGESDDVVEDDQDVVILSTGTHGLTKYHRDPECRYAQRISDPQHKQLDVLGGFAEPCSFCCPEAETESGEDVDGPDDESLREDNTASGSDADTDDDGLDSAPLIEIPDDADGENLGNYEVKDYGSKTVVLGSSVCEHFDSDQVSVRDLGGFVALVPGESEEWPDYSVGNSMIQVGSPGCEVVGVGVGDEVRATAVGDVVKLEPVDETREVPPPEGETTDDVNVSDSDGSAEDDSGGSSGIDEISSTCECEETFDSTLAHQVHQTEKHGRVLEDLNHLEPGGFGRAVNEAGTLRELTEIVGLSQERTLRLLDAYGLERVVGADDVELSSVTDWEFDVDRDDDVAVPDEANESGGRPTGASLSTSTRADGGAVSLSGRASSTTDGPGQRCQNCGSHVTKGYAKVHTPEDQEEKGPRVCPNCEDKVRDGGDVREARSSRGNGGGSV